MPLGPEDDPKRPKTLPELDELEKTSQMLPMIDENDVLGILGKLQSTQAIIQRLMENPHLEIPCYVDDDLVDGETAITVSSNELARTIKRLSELAGTCGRDLNNWTLAFKPSFVNANIPGYRRQKIEATSGLITLRNHILRLILAESMLSDAQKRELFPLLVFPTPAKKVGGEMKPNQ